MNSCEQCGALGSNHEEHCDHHADSVARANDDARIVHRRESDENTIIAMIERNGEAWLADILVSALEIRADGFVGPEWRGDRLADLSKKVAAIKIAIEAEDMAGEADDQAVAYRRRARAAREDGDVARAEKHDATAAQYERDAARIVGKGSL